MKLGLRAHLTKPSTFKWIKTSSQIIRLAEMLAPVSHDSGTLREKRVIAGGRRALRCAMFQAALIAADHDPTPGSFADRLRAAGTPHNVINTAVARKLVTIANALCTNFFRKGAPSAT